MQYNFNIIRDFDLQDRKLLTVFHLKFNFYIGFQTIFAFSIKNKN